MDILNEQGCTDLANQTRTILEDHFRHSCLSFLAQNLGSFRIAGFYPEDMIASGQILFDQVEVICRRTRFESFETNLILNGVTVEAAEELGYLYESLTHDSMDQLIQEIRFLQFHAHEETKEKRKEESRKKLQQIFWRE